MKLVASVLLIICLSIVVVGQTNEVLRLKGELEFGGPERDSIVTHKLLDDGKKLLLVGRKTVKIIDVTTGTIVATHPINVPEYVEDSPRVISPDGRRMLVFGNSLTPDKKDKINRPSSIWDLETGKQVAVLQREGKPIRSAKWSKNGKTLVTTNTKHLIAPPIQVSFWDGETFEYLSSLPAENVGWFHLSGDGDQAYFTTAPIRNLIVLGKLISPTGGPVSIWNTHQGKLERTIGVNAGDSLGNTRAPTVTPDGRLLIYVAEPEKSNDRNHRLVAWEIGNTNAGQIKAKYEIKPSPKFSDYGVFFNHDGKYFYFDAGKSLQVYETSTGDKRFELSKDDVPSHWLDDNKIILYDYRDKMVAAEVATGKILYSEKLIYRASESMPTETIGDQIYFGQPQVSVHDQTEIIPHPERLMFLTQSKQYVKIWDGRSGAVLQTIVAPAVDNSKKKPTLSDKPLVWKADWANNGHALFIIDEARDTISIWERVK